jgi:DNA helicase-2/ATP-dependent DNA helicase PcrA
MYLSIDFGLVLSHFLLRRHPACYSHPVSYFDGLNERQRGAVTCTDGPLLIVAGAGAGKTKTITHRIAHLIADAGVAPHHILALTFTNKAAGEMRERVRKLLKGRAVLPLLTTFHSLGVRLLREFHKEAGIPRGFSIWDRDDSMKALKAILTKLGSDLQPKNVLAAISRKKGDGMSGAEYAAGAKNYREQGIARVWDLYEKVLKDEEALDFDDLLLRTLTLLQNSPEILSLLQDRWTHITIDEYQDTNRSQYEIARLLSGERKNICVVGDTDQNIYSWRGADIEHLLGFETAFPGARVITLEQNYRSTRTILSAANTVIGKNMRRKPKTLFTENETGEPISFYGAHNEADEAWFVVQSAAHLIEKGMSPSKIAVLYRENFQSRVLEEAFLHAGIPYRVLGTRFFERREVKDVLSYVRAALNPASRNDITRIIGIPPRGIGKVTLDKMFAGDDAGIPSAARTKVAAFRTILEAIRRAAETVPTSQAVRFAIEASGIETMLKKDTEEGHERLGNVRELVNLSTKYDDALPPEGIERLLEEAALQSEQDELERPLEAVALMTVHASKGLEFDAVFVTGLEYGLFPSERESDTERDPEEERRLFYVAITRAARRLYLSYARERMKYGSRESALPSEFLSDIDNRLMTSAVFEEPAEDIIE